MSRKATTRRTFTRTAIYALTYTAAPWAPAALANAGPVNHDELHSLLISETRHWHAQSLGRRLRQELGIERARSLIREQTIRMHLARHEQEPHCAPRVLAQGLIASDYREGKTVRLQRLLFSEFEAAVILSA